METAFGRRRRRLVSHLLGRRGLFHDLVFRRRLVMLLRHRVVFLWHRVVFLWHRVAFLRHRLVLLVDRLSLAHRRMLFGFREGSPLTAPPVPALRDRVKLPGPLGAGCDDPDLAGRLNASWRSRR